MISKPWECPRCRTWNSPISLKCDCKPIKRKYCNGCLSSAFAIFLPPFPSMDIIEAYAESFHKNYCKENSTDDN